MLIGEEEVIIPLAVTVWSQFTMQILTRGAELPTSSS